MKDKESADFHKEAVQYHTEQLPFLGGLPPVGAVPVSTGPPDEASLNMIRKQAEMGIRSVSISFSSRVVLSLLSLINHLEAENQKLREQVIKLIRDAGHD